MEYYNRFLLVGTKEVNEKSRVGKSKTKVTKRGSKNSTKDDFKGVFP